MANAPYTDWLYVNKLKTEIKLLKYLVASEESM